MGSRPDPPPRPGRRVPDPRLFDARYDVERLKELTPRPYTVNGKFLDLYAVGDLAQMLGREAGTMRKWERNGILPKTPYTIAYPHLLGARRLYTAEMILGIVAIARAEKVLVMYSGDFRRTQFTTRCKQLFKEELSEPPGAV